MSNELSALQTLTDTAIDSARGYEQASEVAKTPSLKGILREQATRRRALVAMLNAEIVRLGGTERMTGTALGAAHHVWTSITGAFSDGDESAAERVEEGEGYIEAKVREALEEARLSAQTRDVLVRVHAEIAEGERLTDRLEAQYD